MAAAPDGGAVRGAAERASAEVDALMRELQREVFVNKSVSQIMGQELGGFGGRVVGRGRRWASPAADAPPPSVPTRRPPSLPPPLPAPPPPGRPPDADEGEAAVVARLVASRLKGMDEAVLVALGVAADGAREAGDEESAGEWEAVGRV